MPTMTSRPTWEDAELGPQYATAVDVETDTMLGGRVESKPAVAWIVVTDVSGVNVEVNGEARTKSTSSRPAR